MSSETAELNDPEWLEREYWANERSTYEIAAELGCGPTAVQRAMRRHDIDRRVPTGPDPESDIAELNDPAWLEREYWFEGRTTIDIADDLGCCPTTVQKWMDRHGIGRRTDNQPPCGPREFQCEECRKRCTWNPGRTVAYGHHKQCPERDDEALNARRPGGAAAPPANDARPDGGASG